ncbi:hypothetical protein DM867_01480 [Halosegnis rubeus]|uniref:Uncharacterized protein n=1 Tax=Halosegnis rubeus TaxID=2212850 RepID=A0A5N5UEH3_9EURY|nr:hypothetical protein [Halosegnis rubeus]KAB7515842.1 hypothetical protein DM867_01480 [Halosegnis rubeus]
MRRLLAVGVVVVAVGLVATVAPGVADFVPADGLSSLVGFLAVLGVIGGVTRRARADPDTPDLPTLETVAVEPPGSQFDEQVKTAATGETRRAGKDETAVRTRLREAAVQMLVREGHSESAANEQLRAGTWTDDPEAASFFVPKDSEIPQKLLAEARTDVKGRRSVRSLFAETTVFERSTERVVAVLDERLSETAAMGAGDVTDYGRPERGVGAAESERTDATVDAAESERTDATAGAAESERTDATTGTDGDERSDDGAAEGRP